MKEIVYKPFFDIYREVIETERCFSTFELLGFHTKVFNLCHESKWIPYLYEISQMIEEKSKIHTERTRSTFMYLHQKRRNIEKCKIVGKYVKEVNKRSKNKWFL